MTRNFSYLAAALGMLIFAGCGDVPGGGATVATNTVALKPLAPAPEDKDVPVTPSPLAPSALSPTGPAPATPAAEQPPGQPANGQPANPVAQSDVPPVGQPASGETSAPKTPLTAPPAGSGGGLLQSLFGDTAAPKTTMPSGPANPPTASPAGGQEQIVIAGADLARMNANSIHFDITYSFAQGQPSTSSWYTVAIREHAGGSAQPLHAEAKIEGSTLRQHGDLKGNIQIGGRAGSFDIHILEASSRDAEGRQISDVFEAPIHRDRTGERKATSVAGPAGVGIGAQGKGYGAGIVTTPVATLFTVKETIAFKIQIPQAMKFFEAQNNRKPNSNDEFMEKIIKDNQITLPELPAGEKYIYDPQAGQLMYTHPNE